MELDPSDMQAFVWVVRRGSFASAARELRISTTSISRRVANLEAALGARLLHRTTRKLSLTPMGSVVLERAERLLADLQELKDTVAGDTTLRGHIRVTAGVALGFALLHECLPTFLKTHPDVSIEIAYTDRPLDLVAERIDLAIRIGRLSESSLVARRLGSVGHIICASPTWLEAHGPLTPESLRDTERIVDTNQPLTWHLTGPDGQTLEVAASGRYAVNSAHAVRDACRAGLGVAMLPHFLARPCLACVELTEALPGWRGPEMGLYSLILERRWASAAVRALIEHLEESVSTRL